MISILWDMFTGNEKHHKVFSKSLKIKMHIEMWGAAEKHLQEVTMRKGELGRVYEDGETICKEGDKADVMYAIQSGKVKITKHGHTGELTLATLGNGDIFGEMALFDKLPRSATATALGEARVLSIDKKKLFATISNDPTLVFKILETMSQRIRSLNETLMGLSHRKVA